MYALIDCNNFYASCERVFQPWLNKIPIVVLSNNDGCVIARSQEVKDLGIKMGEPAFKLKEIFNRYNIKIFSSNYTLYGDMSQRVMNILSYFTDDIEIYSIDEAFLSFEGMNWDLIDYGNKIKNTIKQNIGLPVCVGIGPTKTLAKAANYFAKKHSNNDNGIFKISTIEEIEYYLKRLEVSEVWGIGRKYTYFLNKNGIYNAWQFTQASDDWIKKHMSILGLRTKRELLGKPCIPLELQPSPKKAIATTRSFGDMLENLDELKEAIATFASKCAFKLRKQESICNLITVFVNTNRHRKDLVQYSKSIVLKFDYSTNSTIEIIKKALKGLNLIYKKGCKYKKAGIIISGIMPKNQVQISLFNNIKIIKKHNDLMKALDYTNYKIGREKVKLSACGNNRKWKFKKEKLSQCYTTRWDELINIR